MTDPTGKPEKKDEPALDSSIKETFESIVIAFILAFVFRAFVVEAFVIPTGSMAPTLLGKHLSVVDQTSGYRYKTDTRDKFGTVGGRAEPHLIQGKAKLYNKDGQKVRDTGPLRFRSPMTNLPWNEPVQRTEAGDRILVLKYVYAISEPRRWDVVVFKDPTNPQDNFIKRLVGLPNEQLRIVRGNIYSRAADPKTHEPTGRWAVQAKPDHIQRVVWQPVYHSQYVPRNSNSWTSPWKPAGPMTVERGGRLFKYEPAGGAPGVLSFRFDDRTAKDYCAYNDSLVGAFRREDGPYYVEDLAVGVDAKPVTQGGAVTLSIGTELCDFRGGVATDGAPWIQVRPAGAEQWHSVGRFTTRATPLKPGRTTRVVLWHVDHTVSLFVDGEPVGRYTIPLYDTVAAAQAADGPLALSYEGLLDRREPETEARVSVSASGAAMTLSHVNLDRDLYYTHNGRTAVTGPIDIHSDEFFCLGDNSPASSDSRRWGPASASVCLHTTPEHGPDGIRPGLVPRKLMIGRAFFVYFPAPLSSHSKKIAVVPNFGELRFIR